MYHLFSRKAVSANSCSAMETRDHAKNGIKNHFFKWSKVNMYMKHLISILLFISVVSFATAQERKGWLEQKIPFPSVDLKTLDGKTFNTKNIDNNGKPIIICSFVSWCKPCIFELNEISDLYEDWQKETGVKIYVIALNWDRCSISSLIAFIENRSYWNYEFLWDENNNYEQALNIREIPRTYILNGKKEIVWKDVDVDRNSMEQYITVVRKLITETK